jgi:hypothetical protein
MARKKSDAITPPTQNEATETPVLLPGLGWLLSRTRKRRADRVTFLMVVSGFDGETYGPFRTLGDAMEFAEDMNGSIFECTAKEVGWRHRKSALAPFSTSPATH